MLRTIFLIFKFIFTKVTNVISNHKWHLKKGPSSELILYHENPEQVVGVTSITLSIIITKTMIAAD